MAHENNVTVYTADIFQSDVYASMTQNFEMYSNHAYEQHIPSNIDALVDFEMTRRRAEYIREEQQYVDQMLMESPVVVERRSNTSGASSSSGSPATGFSSDDAARASPQNDSSSTASSLQQQRADSCRRSRINNKIKKAKLRFRHKFIGQKLEQSSQMLECMLDAIRQVEAQLISKAGYSETALLLLKQQMGVKDYSAGSSSPVRSIST